ncbi:MAG TPA: metal ABC transporter permease [Kutzneria sp.]|jgi:zinc/manganese transport system permease protein
MRVIPRQPLDVGDGVQDDARDALVHQPIGMVALARPLLFATQDPAVAAARGLPVRLLGLGFLALVGACAAEATQAVGALLLLDLLAVADMWAGLGLSYAVPLLPPSFAIIAVAAGVYAVVLAGSGVRGRTRTAVA